MTTLYSEQLCTAAGLCVAVPDAQIALLERAPPRTPEQDLLVNAPRNAFYAWENPNVVEKWKSQPNTGLQNRRLDILTGNTLGGSSAINGAEWTRPLAAVPAAWGVRGLTERVARRLFARAARQLRVAPPPPALEHAYVHEWLEAAASQGVPTAAGTIPIGQREDAAWVNRLTADAAGRRMDACTAYLKPVVGAGNACASNLHLIQDATATKVVLAGGTASGVEYVVGGDMSARHIVNAKVEVISSAGPFQTPKLLQLSGGHPLDLVYLHGS